MKVAYVSILNDLLKRTKDPDEQVGLKNILTRVRSDKLQLPAGDCALNVGAASEPSCSGLRFL